MYAAFFAAGVVVGLAASVPIVTIFWIGARKIASAEYKNELLRIRSQAYRSNDDIEKKVKQLKSVMGEPLSSAQEVALREELEATITRPSGRS